MFIAAAASCKLSPQSVGEINIGVPTLEKQRTITPSDPPVGVPGGDADNICLSLNNMPAGDTFGQLPH